MRSSSIEGCLCFEHFWFGPLCLCLKFEENPISGCWDIQLSIFLGLLPLVVVFFSDFQALVVLVWSPTLKFKIWGRSDQWLLIYSTLKNLRSSSIGGLLPLEVVFLSSIFILVWSLSLSFFEENPTRGCWVIQRLMFNILIFHLWLPSFQDYGFGSIP